MASRVAVVFTIVLALFVLSSFQAQARVQLQEPENLATEWNPSNNLPDSDSDSDAKSTISILLPTDRIQSYSEEIPDDRAVETEPKDLPESDADSTTVRSMRPFKVSYDDGFRPINHHFHHMPLKHHQPFHFRFPIRCRHHQQLGKPMGRGRGMGMGPRFTYGREISYGNDMIMSEEAKFDPMPRFHQGEMRRIPGMMIPRRPLGDNNGFREEDQMERHHHHHRHHHEEEHEHEREREREHEHKHEHEHEHEHEEREEREEKEGREEEGGFMFLRNFRKFLTDMKP